MLVFKGVNVSAENAEGFEKPLKLPASRRRGNPGDAQHMGSQKKHNSYIG